MFSGSTCLWRREEGRISTEVTEEQRTRYSEKLFRKRNKEGKGSKDFSVRWEIFIRDGHSFENSRQGRRYFPCPPPPSSSKKKFPFGSHLWTVRSPIIHRAKVNLSKRCPTSLFPSPRENIPRANLPPFNRRILVYEAILSRESGMGSLVIARWKLLSLSKIVIFVVQRTVVTVFLGNVYAMIKVKRISLQLLVKNTDFWRKFNQKRDLVSKNIDFRRVWENRYSFCKRYTDDSFSSFAFFEKKKKITTSWTCWCWLNFTF